MSTPISISLNLILSMMSMTGQNNAERQQPGLYTGESFLRRRSGCSPAFLALYAIERGFGNIGFFFTITAVFVFVVRFAVGSIMDSKGSKILMIPAFIVYIICFLFIAFLKSYKLLLVVALVYGTTQGIINPTMNAFCFRLSKPESRAVASAVYYTAIDLGNTAAGFVHNMIAMKYDYTAVYIFAAILSVLAFGCYLLCERKLAKLHSKNA